jgi:ribosomal protein S12 methylthiotransferase accessory factor
MSEIYPLDDLEWENNSVGNAMREAILHLPQLDDEECADLLDTLNELDLQTSARRRILIGLAPDEGSLWADLRIGELKTLLALAEQLFGAEVRARATALLQGDASFSGLLAPGLNLAGCTLHRKLLQAYDKAHRAALAA